MARSTAQDIKVGLFVTLLLLAIGLATFVLGGSTDMLAARYTLHGSWADVAGLKEGAVVRLAGWDVGEVSAIRFSDDLAVKEIFIEMKVLARYKERIRKDSEARIDTQGVLGDKYISVTMGSPELPELEDGDWIQTRNALDILEYTKTATDILTSTNSIARKVDLLLGSDQEAAQASLAKSFQHLSEILDQAENGKGLLHALVYDEAMTRSVQGTLANLESASQGIKGISDEIQSGEGLANELIYGDEGAALAVQLGQLAGALSSLTADLKNEDSLVHSLLYDPSKAQLVDDLAVTAAALAEASTAISAGEGTAGLLVRDPTLYEDLRALVGGAQRNKLLRAYIRQTVKQGEESNATPWEPVQ